MGSVRHVVGNTRITNRASPKEWFMTARTWSQSADIIELFENEFASCA
jgi:hypothetical protein